MKKLLLSILAVSLVTVMYAQLGNKPLLLHLNFNNADDIAFDMQGKAADTATAGFTADGKFQGCASFDGSQAIIMESYDTLNCTSSFSWAFWFKTTQTGGSLVQWGHWSDSLALPNGPAEPEEGGKDPHWPGDVSLFMGWNTGGITYDVGFVGLTDVGGDNPVVVNDGLWHHFVLSCEIGDPTTESFYIDGMLASTAEVGAGFIDEDGAQYKIKIGYASSAWPSDPDGITQYPYYTGLMDEFRIYAAALNSYEVMELFALEPTSVNALDAEQDFSVFPNPASDFITIKSRLVRDLEIFNTLGQLLLSEKNLSDGSRINISGFEKGLYLLKSGDYIQKLVIK